VLGNFRKTSAITNGKTPLPNTIPSISESVRPGQCSTFMMNSFERSLSWIHWRKSFIENHLVLIIC
jgi:hypothetical protein